MEVPHTTQKSFPLRISSVNVTKSEGNCRFSHIYWRNPYWKTSLSVQWQLPGCCFSDDICFIHSYRDFVVYNTLFVGTFRSSQQRCSIKKVFIKILQNLQGNTFVGVSFLIKKKIRHRRFPVNIARFLKSAFLQKTSGGRLLLYFIFFV